MTLSESIIKNYIAKITHPGSGRSVTEHISKVVIKGSDVYLTLYSDNASQDELEKTAQKIKHAAEEAVHCSVHVSLTNRIKGKTIEGVNKVIVVASGKGGVGKSTIAFNLAISLANEGYKVGFADADIYGPSLPTLSGISSSPPLEDNLMIPHKKFGIKMMSVGFLLNNAEAGVWRGPMTTKVLYQIIRMTKWSDNEPLDFLIIDTPPGTGDVHLSLAENYAIDGVIIVTTPQKLSIADARKGINMYQKLGIPIIGLVENMSYLVNSDGKKHYLFGKGGGAGLAKELGVPLLTELMLDQTISDSAAEAKPFTYYELKSDAGKKIKELVLRLVDG